MNDCQFATASSSSPPKGNHLQTGDVAFKFKTREETCFWPITDYIKHSKKVSSSNLGKVYLVISAQIVNVNDTWHRVIWID